MVRCLSLLKMFQEAEYCRITILGNWFVDMFGKLLIFCGKLLIFFWEIVDIFWEIVDIFWEIGGLLNGHDSQKWDVRGTVRTRYSHYI